MEIKIETRNNLDKVPEDYRARVLETLDEIAHNHFFGKKLSGKRSGQYSVRVWPYRIIYIVKKTELIVLVVEFGHRQGVY